MYAEVGKEESKHQVLYTLFRRAGEARPNPRTIVVFIAQHILSPAV